MLPEGGRTGRDHLGDTTTAPAPVIALGAILFVWGVLSSSTGVAGFIGIWLPALGWGPTAEA
jgi:hypothetical protein